MANDVPLVHCEVVGHPLQLGGGARIQVGERIGLNPMNEQHQEILERGWVRRIEVASDPQTGAVATAPQETTVVDGPPANKMLDPRKASPKTDIKRKGSPNP